ncbi:uncharacterized protein LOC141586336 [Silene latifolia]|uniref:uncharacterized protein LOC141586336 n=1 Tax=Silene latifolia TaxID=37657 RepID=UPI003D77E9F7
MKELHILISTHIFICALCLAAVHALTHPGDILALKNLKKGIEPTSITFGSCLSSWDLSMDPCDNLFGAHFTCGLRCDFSLSGLSRVTEIALDSAGYSGSLTSTTWDFPYLHTLDLSGNSFSGQLPESLSRLTRLRRLFLSRNLFSLSIPYSLGSLPYLEELYLDNNQFSGSIPPSLNKLSHLKRLEIQQNQFSGDFPYLGSLKNLYILDASQNSISSLGSNPLSLPASLISFSMRNNNLTGEMPRKFFHMEFLEVIDLSYNQLSGSIPGELFQHPSLQQLNLCHNRFSAVETASNIKNIGRKIVAVDLSYNEIDGLLPKIFSRLPNLSALSLEHNRFTGMIPSGYAIKVATALFQRLLLGGNYLFGPIPGPLKRVKPGSVNVSLVDNCLFACPETYFFCKGGDQKSLLECKTSRHSIP